MVVALAARIGVVLLVACGVGASFYVTLVLSCETDGNGKRRVRARRTYRECACAILYLRGDTCLLRWFEGCEPWELFRVAWRARVSTGSGLHAVRAVCESLDVLTVDPDIVLMWIPTR